MLDFEVVTREDGMGLIRSSQSLREIQELYLSDRSDKMVLTSAFIHQSQKDMIDLLAKSTGKGKAEVLRDLIDEWVELQVDTRGNGQ